MGFGGVLGWSLGHLQGALSGSRRLLEGLWRMLGPPREAKRELKSSLNRKTLIFDKSGSRVGASMVLKGRSVPGGTKDRQNSSQKAPESAWKARLKEKVVQECSGRGKVGRKVVRGGFLWAPKIWKELLLW